MGPQLRGQEPLAVGSREDPSQKASPHSQAFPCAAGGTLEERLSDPTRLTAPHGDLSFPAGQGRRCYLEILYGTASLPGGYDLICGSLGVAPETGAKQVPAKSLPIATTTSWASGVGQDDGLASGVLGLTCSHQSI